MRNNLAENIEPLDVCEKTFNQHKYSEWNVLVRNPINELIQIPQSTQRNNTQPQDQLTSS